MAVMDTRQPRAPRSHWWWCALVCCLSAGFAAAQEQEQAALKLGIDPQKVVTAEACGECHVSAFAVWEKTPHATGFKTLHRKEAAEAIAQRLGFPLIKRESPCLRCHYTPEERDGQLRAVSGVSCESCHGAARDWINVHNDYGGKGFDHTNETPEHREERIAASRAAGMRRPSDLYALASSCYGCHTVPDERLVNEGRHSIGSAGFELAKWAEGDIRHNFLDSFLDGDGTKNAERPPERLRMMYVTGRALELEHSLRGLAAATEEGVYVKAMQRRLRDALVELRAIDILVALPEVESMLVEVKGVKATLGQRTALLAAADKVGTANRRFLNSRIGTRLAALDPLRLGTTDAGTVVAAQEEPEEEAVAALSAGDGSAAPTVAGGQAAGATAAGATSPAAGGISAVPAEGEKKSHLRPTSRFKTLAAAACQRCHGDQHAWWYSDPHYASIEPFLEKAAKNVQIARLYGLQTGRLTRGDQLCMDCHGTVASGSEKRTVQDGVSCQSCHGPAADYLEPHQEGDKSLGLQRPGYRKALQLGMVELEDLSKRAATCTGCHYITDPRLLSAGHPSGAGFDFVGGMSNIKHWQAPLAPAATIKTAFAGAIGSRGSVPTVRLARLASPAPGSAVAAGGASGEAGDGDEAGTITVGTRRPTRPQPPTPRPVDPRSVPDPADVQPLDLPPFPELGSEASVEDILRLVKERLQLLYQAVGEGGEEGPGG